MKEGMTVGVLLWNGKVISVEPPNTVELEIVETDPGVKGNTAVSGCGRARPASCRRVLCCAVRFHRAGLL